MVRSTINGLNDRQILLVTVEGRQPGKSIGMSLTMLADLFIEFRAVEAINLDGGGFHHDGDPEQGRQ